MGLGFNKQAMFHIKRENEGLNRSLKNVNKKTGASAVNFSVMGVF